jgi:prophage maintenance system killer protein
LSTNIHHLTLDRIKELHEDAMGEEGPSLLRYESGLESVLFNIVFAGDQANADIYSQATKLCEGISQRQPYLTGNKRTAVKVTIEFFKINGYSVESNATEIMCWLEEIASGQRGDERNQIISEFEDWLRKVVVRVKP